MQNKSFFSAHIYSNRFPLKKVKWLFCFTLMISYSFLEAQTNIFPSSGSVGIGTTTPQRELDVVGALRLSTGYIIRPDNGGIAFSVSNAGNDSYGELRVNNAPGSRNNMIVTDAGNVGIGVDGIYPSAKLHINGIGANLALTNSGNGSGLFEIGMAYCTGCFSGQSQAGDAVLRVLGTGNMLFNIPGNSTDTRKIIFSRDDAKLMQVNANGSVAIGNVNQPAGYKLFVETGILTEKLKVSLKNTSDWADYVFDKNYKLKPLKEVESFVNKNHHLPDMPSAYELTQTGIDVAKMNALLLQKIEELTLYLINMNKRLLEIENRK